MSGRVIIILGTVILAAVISAAIVWTISRKRKEDDQTDWYQESANRYRCEVYDSYFFHPDRSSANVSWLLETRGHETAYVLKQTTGKENETSILLLDNSLNQYQSSHAIGEPRPAERKQDESGIDVKSTFDFDGEDIWDYLGSRGYSYKVRIHGLAYSIDIDKEGKTVGVLHSSNNGKNFFGTEGPIEAKVGSKGVYILECGTSHLDMMVLFALAFAKNNISIRHTS